MHPQSLGQASGIRDGIHNVEDGCLVEEQRLLLPQDAAQIFIGQFKKALQLGHPLLTDFAGGMCRLCLVEQPLRLFLVGPRHVEGVFQCCLVLECPVVFHGTSLAPFPG